jgi:hypothetical protein
MPHQALSWFDIETGKAETQRVRMEKKESKDEELEKDTSLRRSDITPPTRWIENTDDKAEDRCEKRYSEKGRDPEKNLATCRQASHRLRRL